MRVVSGGSRTSRTLACLILSVAAGVSLLVPPAASAGDKAKGVETAGAIPGPVDWDACKGKVIYLDFWASWCAPCKHSFPWLKDLQERHGSEGLKIVAVNLDRDPKAAAAFLAAMEPNFEVVSDPKGEFAKAYDLKAMPTSYIYERSGKLRKIHQGFSPGDQEELEELLEALLKGEDEGKEGTEG